MTKKKDTAPEGTAPEGTAPEDTAPEGTAPEGTAPEDTAPEGTAPEDTAPEDTAPEDTAPEGTAPEGTAPENTAPENTAPENTVPENTVLEEIDLFVGRNINGELDLKMSEDITVDALHEVEKIIRAAIIEKRYGGESDETIEVCVLTQFYDKYTGRQYAPGTILVCTRARAMEIEVNLGEGYIEPHSADE